MVAPVPGDDVWRGSGVGGAAACEHCGIDGGRYGL